MAWTSLTLVSILLFAAVSTAPVGKESNDVDSSSNNNRMDEDALDSIPFHPMQSETIECGTENNTYILKYTDKESGAPAQFVMHYEPAADKVYKAIMNGIPPFPNCSSTDHVLFNASAFPIASFKTLWPNASVCLEPRRVFFMENGKVAESIQNGANRVLGVLCGSERSDVEATTESETGTEKDNGDVTDSATESEMSADESTTGSETFAPEDNAKYNTTLAEGDHNEGLGTGAPSKNKQARAMAPTAAPNGGSDLSLLLASSLVLLKMAL